MKTKLMILVGLAVVLSLGTGVYAQGTGFTYQGRLNSSGNPASGTYDFRFKLFVDSFGNTQAGSTVLTNGVPVTNGLFTVAIDFGTGMFTGTSYWLEVGVRTNGAGGYTSLAPLQALTPSPYAIFAAGASSAATATTAASATTATTATTASAVGANGVNQAAIQNNAVTSAKIAAGQVVKSLTVGANTLYDNVTLAQGNNVTLTPSGQTVTIAATGGQSWSLAGNSGTTPGSQFVGTTDNQALQLHANGQRALRLEPDTSGSGAPNVLGGSGANFVASGVRGAFIGGGGMTVGANSNSIAASFSTIGGGSGNSIQSGGSGLSTIAGGCANSIQASADFSSIGGGLFNQVQANAYYGTISGGTDNTITGNFLGQSIGGGQYNTNNGQYATIPGGYKNSVSGNYSFAAGVNAHAVNAGCFVWADSYIAGNPFTSTADNQVSFRCNGGVLFTSGSGASYQTVSWAPGGSSWSFSSDRNLKDNFSAVDTRSVLDKVAHLPVSEWSYKGFTQRHIGPMAQDFHALFPLNDSDRMLDDADLHGVALAAIKGLDEKVNEQMKAKDAEIRRLEETVAQLREIVNKLAGTEKTETQQ